MEIAGTTALVTGANRGLGRHLAEQLRDRGATVYGGARNPASVELSGVIPIALDVTDIESVAAAAAATGDVEILINNAGSSTGSSLLTGDLARHPARNGHPLLRHAERDPGIRTPAGRARAECDPQHPLRALLGTFPQSGAYCAAKSAEWALTNALRLELATQGTRVSSLHVGYMDTDMTAGIDAPKADPADVARMALDGIVAGDAEIIADEITKHVLDGLSTGVAGLYPEVA